MAAALLFMLALQATAPPAAARLDRLVFSAETSTVALDMSRLHGRPTRLAWSADGGELYLRTAEYDRWLNERAWHYRISPEDGSIAQLDGEPAWSAAYWARKSALAAPGSPGFRIEVETRQQMKTATGVVNDGGAGQSGGDPTGPGAQLGPQGRAIFNAGVQSQKVETTTFRAKGQILAEFVNTPAVPGLTYGWAVGGPDLLAFVNRKGRLAVMDREGHTRVVATIKSASLPAWSVTGNRIACLEHRGGKKYALRMVAVASH